jgi:tetratricopeptide (TPR) repeat protein
MSADQPRPAGVPARSADQAAPAQLPADTADFTGRGPQVGLLRRMLAAPADAGRPGAVVISAVAGMGGVGKTALAVHVAHQLRARFPGGQLFVGLQGATSPLAPGEVLARLLRDLGVPDTRIPAGEAERAALYRTVLADRRILIVLDDARDAAQVRPLLPGTAPCKVIVTSRGTLLGLAGVTLLDLEVLDPAEARALFKAIVGTARAAAEPEAVATVLACCAGLPLALRIAGSRLGSRPHWSVAHLAALLAAERTRLAELTSGDLAVRASFGVSYEALPAWPARVFRLLGLAAPAELGLPAVAALAGQPAGQVADALEVLTDSHLVQSPGPDRFRLHDLLRSYAAELAGATESDADRAAATGRLLRWYADAAVAATLTLEPSRRFPAAMRPGPDGPPPLAKPAAALDWYEAELPALLAATRQASRLGLHDVAAQLAAAMWDFFARAPYPDEWLDTCQTGLRSARQLDDDFTLSWMLSGYGAALNTLGRFAEAHDCLAEALAIRRRTGDRAPQAATLNSLGVGQTLQGRYEQALDYLQQALAIFIELNEPLYVGIVRSNMGTPLLGLKRHAEALDCLTQALAINQETGERHGQGITESKLGDTYLDLGRLDEAVTHYRLALDALDDTEREHDDQADVLCNLGHCLVRLGRLDQARQAWLSALPILDKICDPRAAELREHLADLDQGSTSVIS